MTGAVSRPSLPTPHSPILVEASTLSKQLDKARAAVKKKNFEYAAELYNLHLKVTPGDVEARKELRAASRAHKKLNGSTGFMAKARAKKIELQASAIRVNKKDPEKSSGGKGVGGPRAGGRHSASHGHRRHLVL